MTPNHEIVRDGVFTVAEAASFAGLSRSKLYNLMDAQQLAYVKIGRSRRIPRSALIGLLAANLTGGRRA